MRVYTKNHLDVFAEEAAAYWSVFWETLNSYLSSVPHPEQVFPAFLQPGTREIFVALNRWGLTVASREAEEWAVTKIWSDEEEVTFDETFKVGMLPQAEPSEMFLLGIEGTTGEGELPQKAMPWHLSRTVSEVSSDTFDTDHAISTAKDVALFFTTQHLLGLEDDEASTPSGVATKLRELVNEFEQVLNAATREEDVQTFLTQNPALIDLRATQIIPKFKLGDDFITDYVICLPGSEHILVEIEAASRPLYTSKNEQASEMTHAVKQVEDWLEWAYDNRTYLASKLPGLHEPQGLVVMGRRHTLSDAALKSLRRRNQLSVIKVRTFDDLIDTARAAADNIERLS